MNHSMISRSCRIKEYLMDSETKKHNVNLTGIEKRYRMNLKGLVGQWTIPCTFLSHFKWGCSFPLKTKCALTSSSLWHLHSINSTINSGFWVLLSCALAVHIQLHNLCKEEQKTGIQHTSHPLWLRAFCPLWMLLTRPCCIAWLQMEIGMPTGSRSWRKWKKSWASTPDNEGWGKCTTRKELKGMHRFERPVQEALQSNRAHTLSPRGAKPAQNEW